MSHMEQQHRAYHNLAFMLAAMGLTEAGIEDTIGFMNNYSDIDVAEEDVKEPQQKTEKIDAAQTKSEEAIVNGEEEILQVNHSLPFTNIDDIKNVLPFTNIDKIKNVLEARKTDSNSNVDSENTEGEVKPNDSDDVKSKGARQYSCEKCDETFTSVKKQSFHLGVAHGTWYKRGNRMTEPPPHCKPCKQRFTTEEQLKEHLLNKQNIHRPRDLSDICAECGFTSSVPSTLDYHRKHFHDNTVHICKPCNKEFKGRKKLECHTRTFHREKGTCSLCGKVVRRIKHHMASRHTKSEDQRHKCQFCEKGFFCKDKLRDHENIHTGNKPYKCRVAEGWCSYSCADHGNRSKHEILCRKRWIKSETNEPKPKAD